MQGLVMAAIAAVIISVTTLSAQAYEFETFTNSEYGFSIKYPQGWIIDRTVDEHKAEPGPDGGIELVYFGSSQPEDPEDFNHYVSVKLYEDNYNATNYEGRDYLDRQKEFEDKTCEDFWNAGWGCSADFLSSEMFTHNDRTAYWVSFEYALSMPGEDFQDSSITNIVDVIDGNDVWEIYSFINFKIDKSYSEKIGSEKEMFSKIVDSFEYSPISPLESASTFGIMESDGTTSTYGKQGYASGNKAVGTGLTEINSDKICGLSLCTEKMTTAEIIQQYLQSKGLD